MKCTLYMFRDGHLKYLKMFKTRTLPWKIYCRDVLWFKLNPVRKPAFLKLSNSCEKLAFQRECQLKKRTRKETKQTPFKNPLSIILEDEATRYTLSNSSTPLVSQCSLQFFSCMGRRKWTHLGQAEMLLVLT